MHREAGKTIRAGLGHDATYLPPPNDGDLLVVGLNRSVAPVDASID